MPARCEISIIGVMSRDHGATGAGDLDLQLAVDDLLAEAEHVSNARLRAARAGRCRPRGSRGRPSGGGSRACPRSTGPRPTGSAARRAASRRRSVQFFGVMPPFSVRPRSSRRRTERRDPLLSRGQTWELVYGYFGGRLVTTITNALTKRGAFAGAPGSRLASGAASWTGCAAWPPPPARSFASARGRPGLRGLGAVVDGLPATPIRARRRAADPGVRVRGQERGRRPSPRVPRRGALSRRRTDALPYFRDNSASRRDDPGAPRVLARRRRALRAGGLERRERSAVHADEAALLEYVRAVQWAPRARSTRTTSSPARPRRSVRWRRSAARSSWSIATRSASSGRPTAKRD